MNTFSRYRVLVLVTVGILLFFVAHILLSSLFTLPRMNDLFTLFTVGGSLIVLVKIRNSLFRLDYLISLSAGLILGVAMTSATLFTPYPFIGMIEGNGGHALARGASVAIAMLAGLAIMRQGGPVQVHLARKDGRQTLMGLALGLAVGLPLAILNVFALKLTQGEPITWQSPLAALLDALQPAVVEEVVYRFAFLGILWLALKGPMPRQAGWQAGIIALLVHNFMHFDGLWLEAPLTALGMGAVMALLWGLPPTILALRRGLESAIAFHWIQDAARFWTGF